MRSFASKAAMSVGISKRSIIPFAAILGLVLFMTLAMSSSVAAQELVWAKRAGGTGTGDAGTATAVDGSGNIYVTGTFQGTATFGLGEANQTALTSAGNDDIFLARYDSNGLLQWAKRAGGSGLDRGASIAVDGSGDIYVTGFFQGTATFGMGEANQTALTSAGSDDIFLARYDSTGTLQWAKRAGGTGLDRGAGIAVDDLGNSYVTGWFNGTATFGLGEANQTALTSAGSDDIFLAQYDSNGAFQWARRAGGSGQDQGVGIAVDGGGNSYLTGYFNGAAVFGPGQASQTTLVSAGDRDIFVAQYDSSGLLQWVKQSGGTNADRSFGITADESGNIYVTGLFQGTATFGLGEANQTALVSAGGDDIFVAQYDSTGLLQWAKRAGGTGSDGGLGIAVDGLGNSYVTGWFNGTATFGLGEANQTALTSAGGRDIFVAQYDADGLLQWAKRAGSGATSGDQGMGIAVDGLGNSYVPGYFNGTATFGSGEANETALTSAGGADIFVAKYAGDTGNNSSDTTGPALAITSHADNQTTLSSPITLSGTASDSGLGDNGISSVTVNGAAASGGTAVGSATANWSQSATLNPGANLITVVARDASPNQNATTVQITINFSPTVTVTATDDTATEQGPTTGMFTVSRSGGTSSALTVNYTVGGTATSGGDYFALSGSAVILTGQSSAQIVVTPIDDGVIGEGDETVVVILTADAAYTVGAQSNATVTIVDNNLPPLPTVTITATDDTATEQGPTTGTFTVSRSGGTSSALTVNYTVSGTATAGSDYQSLAGNVFIPAGQSSAQIVVTPIDDEVIGEGDETVVVTLTADAAYTIGAQSSATVTIADNDTAPGSLLWAKRAGGTDGGDSGTATAVDGFGNIYVAGIFRGTATFGLGEANQTALTSAGNDDIFLAQYDSNGLLQWVKRAGGSGLDRGGGIAVDGSGDIYVTGLFQGTASFGLGEANETTLTSAGSDDIFVARYDSTGRLQWAKRAGGSGLDRGAGIAVDDLGNSYVTGWFNGTATFGLGEANETTLTSAGSDDIFVAQYDSTGTLQWAGRAGGVGQDQGVGIAVDGLGNSYLTGYFNGAAVFGPGQASQTTLNSAGDREMFFARYDSNGLLQWAKRSGGTNADRGFRVALDQLGNSYVSGSFQGTATFGQGEANQTALTSDGLGDIFVAKHDSAGLLQWVKRAGGPSDDGALGIAVDGLGNSYLTGWFNGINHLGTATFGLGEANQTTLTSAGDRDVFVAQYDSDGLLQWAKRAGAGGLSTDQGMALALDGVGAIYITGFFSDRVAAGAAATFGQGEANETTLTSAGGADIFMAKYAGDTGNNSSDMTGPSLAITSHTDNQTTLSSPITLSGTASDSGLGDNGISSVTVNGAAASGGTAVGSATANWSRSVTLNPGANLITVVARDGSPNQNATTVQITINFSPTVTITATDDTATEQGPTTGMFTVSRSGGTSSALTVSYTVSGTATPGGDYFALSGSAVILTGQSSAQIVVTPIDDGVIGEGDETVVVTLAADAAYTIGAQSNATVTIVDNNLPPLPTVTITATDDTATEQGPTTGIFTVSRSGGTSTALTVNYTVSGTATAGSDYQSLAGNVFIPAGQSSAQIVVTPIDDGVIGEGDETVIVTLTADAAYTIGAQSSATVAIADNDTTPGSLLWAKRAGGAGTGDAGTAVAVDGSGNIYVTGTFQGTATFGLGEANQTTLTSAGNDDIFLAQYDSNGLLQWVKRAGGSGVDRGASIAVDGSGDIYVTGLFQGTATFGLGEANQTALVSAGSDDIFVAQYDSNGLLQWAKRAGGTGLDRGAGIAVDDLGNSYVTGWFNGTATFGLGEANQTALTSAGSDDIFIAQYDSTGTLQWAGRAGGSGQDQGVGIAVDGLGNSYLTGFFNGTAVFGPGQASQTTLVSAGDRDLFVAQYDSAGLLQWAKRSGGTNADRSFGITVDESGNSYVTGLFQGTATFGLGEANQTALTSAGGDDIFVAQYDSTGLLQWAKRAGGTGSDGGLGIAVDGLGNSYVTGWFNGTATFGLGEANQTALTSAGGRDIFVAQYDAAGLLQWAKRAGSAGTGDDQGMGIAVDGFGNSYVPGYFNATPTFGQGEANETMLTSAGGADIFVAKYAGN